MSGDDVGSRGAGSEPRSGAAVCHLISSFRPVVGGAEKRTERLCLELLRLGTEALVLARRYPRLKRRERFGDLEVLRAGLPSRSKLGALTYSLESLWLLATRLRHYRLLHVQSTHAPLLVGLAATCLSGRRRLLLSLPSDPVMLFREAGRWRVALMRRWVDAFTVPGDTMARRLEAEGIPPGRIHVVPSGLDTAEFRPATPPERKTLRERLGLGHDAVVYLFVGRCVALKRLDLLLRAWASLPAGSPRRLLIVGDGPERRRLADLAERLGLHDVRFEGHVDETAPYYRAADVFVLPSSREGLSNALLEAMASGLSVVVSGVPGNREVVEHGRTGLVFDGAEPEVLARRLLEAEERRSVLGSRAREAARGRFSLRRAAEAHRSLYRALSETASRPAGAK